MATPLGPTLGASHEGHERMYEMTCLLILEKREGFKRRSLPATDGRFGDHSMSIM